MELWRRNTYVLWLAVFLSAICWTMVMPFTPVFLTELGVQEHVEFWTGLIVSIASACNLVMSPVWGAIGDRFGRRMMMLRAGIFLVISYALLAIITTPLQFLGVRVMIAALSGFVPMAVALVGVSTPREYVGRAMGIVQTAWPSGALVGPLLGGLVADWVGIRTSFWMSAIVLAFCTTLVATMVKEQFTPPPSHRSNLFADLKVAASNPTLVAIILITTATMASAQALDPVLVLFTKELIGPGAPSWASGLLYSLPGAAFILAAPWWARRGERMGFQNTVARGLLLASLLYLPQAIVRDPYTFGAFRLVDGLAGAAVGPGVAALIATSLPQDLRGRAFGLNQAAGSLGSIVGPLLGGSIASFIGSRGVFLLSAGILFSGYLWVTRVLGPRLKDAAVTTGE